MFCGMGTTQLHWVQQECHHGIWPGAGEQHLPALGSRIPGHLSPIHQTIYHVLPNCQPRGMGNHGAQQPLQ